MSYRKLSRRDFLRMSALAAAGVTFAACGAGAPDVTEQPEETTAEEETTHIFNFTANCFN